MKSMLALLLLITFAIPKEILDQILTWLMPAIIYGVTWVVTKTKTSIPGWGVLMIVAFLGAVATLLTQLLASPGLIWWQQFLFNLLAVVISQFKIQFSSEKIAEDKKK